MAAKKILLERAKHLEPVLRIGKNGLAEGIINEIKNQLQQKKLIKLKLLKAVMEGKDKKELAREIARLTDSELIQQVGFVIVLYKR